MENEIKNSVIPSSGQLKTEELKAAHTPGPWTIDPTTLSICRLIVSVEDVDCDAIISPSHTVAYVPTDYDTDEQHANARLIAAAPDLYAALQLVAPRCNTCGDVAVAEGYFGKYCEAHRGSLKHFAAGVKVAAALSLAKEEVE